MRRGTAPQGVEREGCKVGEKGVFDMAFSFWSGDNGLTERLAYRFGFGGCTTDAREPSLGDGVVGGFWV